MPSSHLILCPLLLLLPSIFPSIGVFSNKSALPIIPDNMLAYGNPCRVIREITEADRDYYFRDRKFDVEDYK